MTLIKRLGIGVFGLWASALALGQAAPPPPGFTVDKEKKEILIPCKMAPRKLASLPEIYPIEVVATFPTPRGQKAHETVVNFDVKPSDVHKALLPSLVTVWFTTAPRSGGCSRGQNLSRSCTPRWFIPELVACGKPRDLYVLDMVRQFSCTLS